MIAALVLALVAAAQTAPQPASDATALAARWQEDLDLDLPGDVVRAGRKELAPGSALAQDGRLVALFARALATTGAADEAQSALEHAQATPATAGFVAVERARALLERDELAAARKALAGSGPEAPVLYPELPDSWLVVARALSRENRLADAAPFFQRFLELAPLSSDAPSAWHQLAQAMVAKGDAARAQQLFQRAAETGTWQGFYRARRLQIREHPEEPLPRLGLAQLLLEANENARARDVLLELVQRSPDFAQGWFHLGEAQRMLGAPADAVASYGRALELDPALAPARFNRAVLAIREQRDAEARADLELVVAGPAGADARLAAAHLELARLLVRAGEQEAAQARYARYRELGGTEPLAPPSDQR